MRAIEASRWHELHSSKVRVDLRLGTSRAASFAKMAKCFAFNAEAKLSSVTQAISLIAPRDVTTNDER